MKGRVKTLGVWVLLLVSGCDQPWNDPYPGQNLNENTLYTSFSERPKHLDPARSYTAAEWPIIGQIYEPPLQYNYFKRPYTLEPLTAVSMPEIHYFNQADQEVPAETSYEEVSYTAYTIQICSNIFYTPHPAFAKDNTGQYRYLNLSPKEAKHYYQLSDFKEKATRELVAEDYVYQLKRLADPSLSSPIFGVMSRYILGLTELRAELQQQKSINTEQDLRHFTLSGAEVIDKYRYRLKIRGKYPPFLYWLATPFFSPVPWEVAQFFAQSGLAAHNISLDWYPVGTGPFQLEENNPERRMILSRNPNFREEYFPDLGSDLNLDPQIQIKFAALQHKRLPMIDKVVYTLEKEEIPYWNKFLQGYYDTSAISSDNFETAVHFSAQGLAELTPQMRDRGITLTTSVSPNVFYWGFNMLDETVGGMSDRAQKLRQAISLAFDVEEFMAIFLNNRGKLANGPLPPGIFGFDTQEPLETITKTQKENNLQQAKNLLKQVGIHNLTLYFDTVATGEPDEIAMDTWLKAQFDKLNIQLIIRGTDYNRYQDKVENGDIQMFFFGWLADYPDPDNFLFLFYGPNSSVHFGGENKTNYRNPDYDKRYEQMRSLENGPQRLQLIKEMITILKNDQPWIWGFYPEAYMLSHQWMGPSIPNRLANNTLKYLSLDPALRAMTLKRWNPPVIWPLIILFALIVLSVLTVVIHVWRQEHQHRGRL